jgi:DNA polymerase-3 subunit delta
MAADYDGIILDIKKNNIKRLYLFYGQERYLVDDIVSNMKSSILNDAFKSLNYIKLEGSTLNFDIIVNACETLPFMDDKKIVIIDEHNLFKGKKASGGNNDFACNSKSMDELCSYIQEIPDTTVLIFIAGEEVDKRSKLYKCIKKNGDVIECTPLKGEKLTKWIEKEFRKSNKKISKSDALYISERASMSLEYLINEINKVCSYIGDRTQVSKQDIDEVVPKSLELNIFQLVDSISTNKTEKALTIFNDMLLDSEPIPVILSMIIRQYRLILNTKLLMESGYSSAEIAGKLGVPTFVISNMQRMSSSFSVKQLEDRLNGCLEADMAIKTGKMDQRIAMEMLIVKFTAKEED